LLDRSNRLSALTSLNSVVVGHLHHTLHVCHRLLRINLDSADYTGDFGRGLTGAFCQLSHFVGDHGKTTSLLTGARGFNRRIERQQIRLIGNFTNRPGDPADFL